MWKIQASLFLVGACLSLAQTSKTVNPAEASTAQKPTSKPQYDFVEFGVPVILLPDGNVVPAPEGAVPKPRTSAPTFSLDAPEAIAKVPVKTVTKTATTSNNVKTQAQATGSQAAGK